MRLTVNSVATAKLARRGGCRRAGSIAARLDAATTKRFGVLGVFLRNRRSGIYNLK